MLHEIDPEKIVQLKWADTASHISPAGALPLPAAENYE